jgi:hypothetical protein
VVAYDSPGGAVIGAVEQGRAYVVLARYGSDWLQAEVSGSGVVWLRADQVLDLPADLADLAPTPAPQLVYVASQPAPAVATIAPPAATDPPAPAELDAAAAAEREQNIRDRLHANGGSGKMEAPTFPTMPAASDSAAQWCAGAAKSGVARCGP